MSANQAPAHSLWEAYPPEVNAKGILQQVLLFRVSDQEANALLCASAILWGIRYRCACSVAVAWAAQGGVTTVSYTGMGSLRAAHSLYTEEDGSQR